MVWSIFVGVITLCDDPASFGLLGGLFVLVCVCVTAAQQVCVGSSVIASTIRARPTDSLADSDGDSERERGNGAPCAHPVHLCVLFTHFQAFINKVEIFSYVKLKSVRTHFRRHFRFFFRKIGTMSVNTDREEDYKFQSVL